MFNGGIPSLKNLSMKVLAVDIQKGEHDSVSDLHVNREWPRIQFPFRGTFFLIQ